MNGQRAGLMNTDPPYGVAYANDERPNPGVAKPRVANDTFKDDELQVFLESAFRVAVSVALREDAAWYLWHAHLTQGFFAAAAAAHVILHRQIIWVKPVLLLGRGQFHWKHEPCQPPGTMVRIASDHRHGVFNEVPIETLVSENRVVSFDTYSSQITGFREGRKVIAGSRTYNGNLYGIEVAGKKRSALMVTYGR
jgi:hypothetical protein